MNDSELKKNTDLIISEVDIDQTIKRLADELNHFFSQAPFKRQVITLYCVMNGGLYFTGQLIRHLEFPLKLNYLHASRYGDEITASHLNWFKRPQVEDIKNQHILLIDDIFDEGLTLEALYQECQSLGADSVHSVVLVDKQHDRKPTSGYKPNFTGLKVEDRYIFGCGMDYKGLYRNLPAIYALKP